MRRAVQNEDGTAYEHQSKQGEEFVDSQGPRLWKPDQCRATSKFEDTERRIVKDGRPAVRKPFGTPRSSKQPKRSVLECENKPEAQNCDRQDWPNHPTSE
ncbi:hypothetical protein MesoLj131a_20600 [Mesorhizobium sp. 131-2-1]|nr:hypothetical protein MesoLj131a_20600 [Mesorhizobium sp. 131-2-1]